MQAHIKKITRRLLPFMLISSMLFSLCIPIGAVPAFPDTSMASGVYLWNYEHDKVIFSKSESEVIYPGSLTKMMTGLVAIDLIGERLDEEVSITKEMLVDRNGTSMQLRVGDKLTYRDLLYGAICGGFNDAATALAVASAGDISAFVAKMNEKASLLGASNTHYTNPTGWHDDNMVTTLHDTAIIAKAAAENDLFLEVSSEASYDIEGTANLGKFTVHNRNGLIGSFYAIGYHNKRAKGLAAGMTDEAGNCVATTFEYDGLSYLLIVVGATRKDDKIFSYEIANEIISHTINYYGEITPIKCGDTVLKTPLHLAVSTGDDDFYMLKCTVADDLTIFTPYDSASLESIELRPYVFDDELSAPVKKGEVIGGVDVFVDGVLRGSTSLISSEDVEANAFLKLMKNAKKMLVSRAFIIFFISFAVLFSIYFFTFELNDIRKRGKKIKIHKIY